MTIEKPTSYTETLSSVCQSERAGPELSLAPLDISRLTIKLTDAPKPLPDPSILSFGVNFSDHMAIATFNPTTGWSAPEIKPRGLLAVDPAASCFQYGCNVFEGMKAYLGQDGKVRLFRPNLNMCRLERSTARLALPHVDGDVVLELIKRFVQVEKRWIPMVTGYSLYIRPTIIGTRPGFGIAASDQSILYIIAAPAGPYFPRPASLLAVSDVVRAWPGGTGAHKVGGNYSPGFLLTREAATQGYDQVLWLFGEERKVTEAGAMNLFVVLKRSDDNGLDVFTPPLDGTILPGVTRLSCLELAADRAFQATIATSASTDGSGTTIYPAERGFTLFDLEQWASEGVLLEFLCVGTAAIVAPVYEIGFEGRVVVRVPQYPEDPHGLGPVGRALRKKILGVQEGRDEFRGWGVVCA